MKRTKIIILVLGIAVLAILGIVGYYWYQGAEYATTDDARVAANVVSVTPVISGELVDWKVREGDVVNAGDTIGRQDLGTALNSGSLNPANLGSVAGVFADKATIKAPIAGQVILSTAIVGQNVSPGMSLAIIADTSSLYISANIKESSIARIAIGENVDVKVDAFPGKLLHGRVESIGRATASTFSLLPSQGGGGNYTKVIQVVPIKIALIEMDEIAHSGGTLMVGMNAWVRVHLVSAQGKRS